MKDIPGNGCTDNEGPCERTPSQSPQTKFDALIRRHPIAAAFASIGVGCAVSVFAQTLLIASQPPPPQKRALRALEDIQTRLNDLAHPALNRAGHLAEDGVHAMKSGIRSAVDSKVAGRLRHLFA